MAVHKQHFTATTFAALSGYDGATADNEVELSATAPGSGSLTASIAAIATETAYVAAVPSAIHDSNDWTALPTADTQVVVGVSSIGADLTLRDGGGWVRFDSSGAQQAAFSHYLSSWDSATGTGVKTLTAGAVVNLGTAAASDLYGLFAQVINGNMMTAQSVTIDLGANSYVEAPWAAPSGGATGTLAATTPAAY